MPKKPQPKALKKYWAEKNKSKTGLNHKPAQVLMQKCSYHKRWYNGVAGACPKCMAKTMKDEKIRIRKQGY